MNTNTKGVKGLIKVIDDLQDNGYYTFTAFDDHSPVDLIALDNAGNTYRLQIKYRSATEKLRGRKYNLSATTVVNGKKLDIDRNLIDGWAVYLAEDNKVVYIHKSKLEGQRSLALDPNEEYGRLAEWSKAPHC